MLSLFEQVLMVDLLAKGTTINWAYYVSLMQKFQDIIKAERRGMLKKGAQLLQNNAPVHSVHVIQMKVNS